MSVLLSTFCSNFDLDFRGVVETLHGSGSKDSWCENPVIAEHHSMTWKILFLLPKKMLESAIRPVFEVRKNVKHWDKIANELTLPVVERSLVRQPTLTSSETFWSAWWFCIFGTSHCSFLATHVVQLFEAEKSRNRKKQPCRFRATISDHQS